jgi:hypothetical protein
MRPHQETRSNDHGPEVSYSNVPQSAEYFVIRKPYGCAISRQEFGEINFLLNTWLDEIPRDSPFPIFNKTNLAYGRIYIECTDETSASWICSIVPKFVASWASGGLMVYPKSYFYSLRKVVINTHWEIFGFCRDKNL